MLNIPPVLPLYLLVIYLVTSLVALCLCLTSIYAIYHTKRTPYPAKLLSLGLLIYDCLFLVTTSVGVFFASEDSSPLLFFSKGFQVSAMVVVSSMSLERLFVLNWPYVYMRIASKRNTRKVCVAIIVLSFLQYGFIRILVCRETRGTGYCARSMAIYYALLLAGILVVSISSYVKIIRIIRNKSEQMTSLKYYKSTAASLMFLVNIAVSMLVYIGLSVHVAMTIAIEREVPVEIATISNFVYLLNCIIDPLIYVLWFKEARLEILKIFSHVCQCLSPSVERMRVEVFNICVIPVAENVAGTEVSQSPGVCLPQ